MRRLPFSLALLPGGPIAGVVTIYARGNSGRWVVRVEGRGAKGQAVAETTAWSSDELHARTGVDLSLVDEVP